jgi:hypothetical protein
VAVEASLNHGYTAPPGERVVRHPATQEIFMIDLAVRTGVTGFGDRPLSLRSEKMSVFLTQRPVGPSDGGHRTTSREVSWTVNGDGTATCEQDRLMWIQAPWGMRWEGGSSFSGAPCPVSWVQAKELFGCGARVGLSKDDTIGLSAEQIRSTGFDFGYKRGTCRVNFAGYSNWRLPTLAEWYTVIGFDNEERKAVLQFEYDERYWTATERYEWILHDFSIYAFFVRKHNCAWAMNPDRWIRDIEVDVRLPIMFVRSL